MDGITRYSPEQAWEAAVAYLAMEMSRSTFDTRVSTTCLVEYKDGTFAIGAPNAENRDWLESRLTSTVERFLVGVMAREVSVRFVVAEIETKDTEDFDSSDSSSVCDKDHPSWINTTDDKTVFWDLDIQAASLRNCLIEPWRVVRLPVYTLRWLPYVGAQTIFLVLALWQEQYLSSNGREKKGNNRVSIRAERICQWAGISRAQFFRLLQSSQDLKWFVRKIETNHEVDKKTGKVKKSSNKYELLDTPLTPGDAQDLKAYLLAQGIKENPEPVLLAAVHINPGEILQFPVRQPPLDFPTMTPIHLTVTKVVQDLIGHRLHGDSINLTEQLSERITAQGEFILVSWYFLKNWLPILGPEAAMFILILRNLCYFNDETGEMRDEVWIDGGYAAIASRLGINNSRLVSQWLGAFFEKKKTKEELSDRTRAEFHRRKLIQEQIGLFIQRVDHRINPNGSYGWKFKIQRTDPLLQQQQTTMQAAVELLIAAESRGVLEELFVWQGQVANGCYETVNSERMVDLRLSNLTMNCSATLKELLDGCFETFEVDFKDCFETLLKILKYFKDSQNEKIPANSQDPSTKNNLAVAVVNSQGNWSLEKLLARADRKNRSTLLAQETNALPFVSWIIYGVSQPNIQNPYSLAIASLKTNPGVGAGGASERLAALPPKKLQQLILETQQLFPPSEPNWRMLFTPLPKERIQLLADALDLNSGQHDK